MPMSTCRTSTTSIAVLLAQRDLVQSTSNQILHKKYVLYAKRRTAGLQITPKHERLKAFRNNHALRQFLVTLFDENQDSNDKDSSYIDSLYDLVIQLTKQPSSDHKNEDDKRFSHIATIREEHNPSGFLAQL